MMTRLIKILIIATVIMILNSCTDVQRCTDVQQKTHCECYPTSFFPCTYGW